MRIETMETITQTTVDDTESKLELEQAGLLTGAVVVDTAAPHPETTRQPTDDFLSFYGLTRNPFVDCVNAELFYRTETHAKAIQRMLLTVRHDISLGMLTGLSGTGKTLVSQIVLQNVDRERHQPILVLVSPGLSKTALLREILAELNVGLPVGINRTQDLLKMLSNYVIDLYHNGRRLVIIIDECHFLSSENIHILRTISNIEIPECKLVTCLLFGETKFAKRLEHPTYASLRNRMYLQWELQPMGLEDCRQYVLYRLMVAGRMEPLFDDGALAALHWYSEGVCRSLSKLCMLSLLEGALSGQPVVDKDIVERCAGLE